MSARILPLSLAIASGLVAPDPIMAAYLGGFRVGPDADPATIFRALSAKFPHINQRASAFIGGPGRGLVDALRRSAPSLVSMWADPTSLGHVTRRRDPSLWAVLVGLHALGWGNLEISEFLEGVGL